MRTRSATHHNPWVSWNQFLRILRAIQSSCGLLSGWQSAARHAIGSKVQLLENQRHLSGCISSFQVANRYFCETRCSWTKITIGCFTVDLLAMPPPENKLIMLLNRHSSGMVENQRGMADLNGTPLHASSLTSPCFHLGALPLPPGAPVKVCLISCKFHATNDVTN